MLSIVGVGMILVFVLVTYMNHRSRLAEKEGVLFTVKNFKSEGDRFLAGKQYAEAKAEYEKAIQTLDQLEEGDIELEAELTALLTSDDITYGMNPDYEKFEGKWMTWPEKSKIQRERFEDEQKAKGLVRVDGKWMTPEEKLEYETTPRVEASSTLEENHISISISGTDMSDKLVVVCSAGSTPYYPEGDTEPVFDRLEWTMLDLGVSTAGATATFANGSFELFLVKREFSNPLRVALTDKSMLGPSATYFDLGRFSTVPLPNVITSDTTYHFGKKSELDVHVVDATGKTVVKSSMKLD